MVQRLLMILALSLSISMCFAQSGKEKNYRFTFVSSVDLCGNIQNISTEYYTNPDPPAQPELVTVTANRKISFGVGMRFQYNFRKKLSYSISGILLDKGYGLTFEQQMTDNSIIKLRDRNGRLYLSLPVELVYKFLDNAGSSLYIKPGASVDIDFHQTPGYKQIGSSFILGIGMSIPVNEKLTISIEPTVRYAMFNYAEEIQFVPDKLDDYKPFSAGIMVCISQLSF